jgi:hypothetical protein
MFGGSSQRKLFITLACVLLMVLNLRGPTRGGLPSSIKVVKDLSLSPSLRHVPPSVFYPWQQLTARQDYDDGSGTSLYSFHKCVEHQTETHVPDYVGRTCHLRNIYFQRSDQSFHYYASPQESKAWGSPEALQNELAVSASYWHYGHNKPVKNMGVVWNVHLNTSLPSKSWVALVNQSQAPSDHDSRTDPLPVFLFYRYSYAFNIGHLFWDDVLSLFTMLDYFGYAFPDEYTTPGSGGQTFNIQHIPIHLDSADPFFRCGPPNFRWDICGPMIKKMYPTLVGVQPVDMNGTLDSMRSGNLFQPGGPGGSAVSDTNAMIRLPVVIAGPGQLAQFGCWGACPTQWTGRLYRFRNWVIRNALGPNFDETIELEERPLPHKILVSLPVGNTHENVEWFGDIVPALQERYGNESVTVVDLATFSMEEQIRLVLSTQVLLTNQGGGSMTSTFLRRGSTLLLFHTGGMFDLFFYKAQGYIHTKWLPATKTPVEKVLDFVELGLQRCNVSRQDPAIPYY